MSSGKLRGYPDKVFIKTISSGVDFLGMVNFSGHRVLRNRTKRRMLKKIGRNKNNLQKGLISDKSFNQSLQSHFGMLKYCNGYGIVREMNRVAYKWEERE